MREAEDVTVNINEHGGGARGSFLAVLFVVLLVFAGAYYIVTTYVAGAVTGVQNWWQGVVKWWGGITSGFHPFGLETLPIGTVLMARKREEKERESGGAAWLILGILFIFFMLGALYVTWIDYLVASAFSVLGRNMWGSLFFPAVMVMLFLALAVISFRKSHELG